MDRQLTDESVIQWRNDTNLSVQDTSNPGRVKFLAPLDPAYSVRRMVARDVDLKPVAVSFGDFNPWAGDWSEVVGNTDHDRRFAAPTSAYWVTDTSVDPQMANALKALMETYAMQISYMDKIKSGVLYLQNTDPSNQVTLQRIFNVNENVAWTKVIDTSDGNLDLTLSTGNWLAFPHLMDMMEATLNGLHQMDSYQGDRAKVKVSASPFGGDTHAQLAATHATMQAASSATKTPDRKSVV